MLLSSAGGTRGLRVGVVSGGLETGTPRAPCPEGPFSLEKDLRAEVEQGPGCLCDSSREGAADGDPEGLQWRGTGLGPGTCRVLCKPARCRCWVLFQQKQVGEGRTQVISARGPQPALGQCCLAGRRGSPRGVAEGNRRLEPRTRAAAGPDPISRGGGASGPVY